MYLTKIQTSRNEIKKLRRYYVLLLIPAQAMILTIPSLMLIYANNGVAFAKFGSIIIVSSLAVIGCFRSQTDGLLAATNDIIRVCQANIHELRITNTLLALAESLNIEAPNEASSIPREIDLKKRLDGELVMRDLFFKTAKTLWLVELSFVAIGTLITTYGADIVNWIH